jgi:hypothetical protein
MAADRRRVDVPALPTALGDTVEATVYRTLEGARGPCAFARTDDGRAFFIAASAGAGRLKPGLRVRLVVGQDRRGRPCAARLEVLS